MYFTYCLYEKQTEICDPCIYCRKTEEAIEEQHRAVPVST